jgi:hypothetical protein
MTYVGKCKNPCLVKDNDVNDIDAHLQEAKFLSQFGQQKAHCVTCYLMRQRNDV